MDETLKYFTIKRKTSDTRPVSERKKDYREVNLLRDMAQTKEQASRCMDCGTPFCSWRCPIANDMPAWNMHLANGELEKAYNRLMLTNNMPEMTGRLCPAPCEYSCVLELSAGDSVTIRDNELEIIEQAFRAGFVKPRPPVKRTGKKVAIIGSGPAGLACADQLNKVGHKVTVFERSPKCGGLLRYGIPDFKLEKSVIDRRLKRWKAEGILFSPGVEVGRDYPSEKLLKEFDAVCLTGGCGVPRDLPIEGRNLSGIHFAMDFLIQSNRRVAKEEIPKDQLIDAKNKRVVIIGGGDTGADCVGTSHRQEARKVVQIEILPKPPEKRPAKQPWPEYPVILKVSTSHEEGGDRQWSVLTKKFLGGKGAVTGLSAVRVEWGKPENGKPPAFKEIPGSEFQIEADLVLLAMGFVHPQKGGPLNDLGIALDARGNVQAGADYQTSVKGVFAAGDMRRGQSLIVWAIQEGRNAAHYIDCFLMGASFLPCV